MYETLEKKNEIIKIANNIKQMKHGYVELGYSKTKFFVPESIINDIIEELQKENYRKIEKFDYNQIHIRW